MCVCLYENDLGDMGRTLVASRLQNGGELSTTFVDIRGVTSIRRAIAISTLPVDLPYQAGLEFLDLKNVSDTERWIFERFEKTQINRFTVIEDPWLTKIDVINTGLPLPFRALNSGAIAVLSNIQGHPDLRSIVLGVPSFDFIVYIGPLITRSATSELEINAEILDIISNTDLLLLSAFDRMGFIVAEVA